MVESLNDQLVAEYKAAFDIIDKDGDGLIDSTELDELFKRLDQKYNQIEIEEMINEIDMDSDKAIDFKEFLALMTKKIKDYEIEDELLETFKVFDKDGNGYISLDELRDIINKLDQNISDIEINEMLKEADDDNDGKLSFEEFVKIMKTY